MKITRRRFWVYLLLFVFSAIAYVDHVNMSVAGKPIAQELGLSPVALGYLFSCFLWAYVLMMLPGGRLIDRWGAHVVAGGAAVVWSIAQMATGAAVGVVTMFMTRLGLGIGGGRFPRWSIAASGRGHPIPSAAVTLMLSRGTIGDASIAIAPKRLRTAV